MMKAKIVLAAIAAVALLSGCGGSSGSSGSGSEIVSGLTGDYDLRSYYAPSADATNIYEEYYDYGYGESYNGSSDTIYTMGIGANFSVDDDGETSDFNVTDSRMTSQFPEFGNDGKLEIARHANVGDTIVNETIDGVANEEMGIEYSNSMNMVCNIKEHVASKTVTLGGESYTFNDVLGIECTFNAEFSYSGGGYSYSEKTVDKSISYFAKGIGEVYAYDRDCYDEEYNQRDDLGTCYSEETEYSVLLETN